MRLLNNIEITNISGGVQFFCALHQGVQLICSPVIWNGSQWVMSGHAEQLQIIWQNGTPTFYI